ncbi:MAG TPA: arsenate reductase ArsC [Bacteroidales bacterium]|nr:arsenate reductase ArsC [Bacteroidales bacterium]
MKILILCTGNSCRSQMAQGYLRSFDKVLEVHSAGTIPAPAVNQLAIKVMLEDGIDISNEKPKSVDKYTGEEWDYVITVCDDANETCPVFHGAVKQRVHKSFEDPSHSSGIGDEILQEFRKVRDLIKIEFRKFYESEIMNNMNKNENRGY